jgi:hypothetical protein
MRRLLPFLFPLIALIVVLALAYRWFTTQTTRPIGTTTPFADQIAIEELNTNANTTRRPVKDMKSVEMKAAEGSEAMGTIRYEIVDGKVYFTVAANLPELEKGKYQVWLKDVHNENRRKAFALTMEKGGYTGSAAISAQILPFEVLVSKEMSDDEQIEVTVLRGVIE